MTTRTVDGPARRAKRRRTLGADAHCHRCGWTEATALSRDGDAVTCYECQATTSGKRTTERHHHLGRHNAPATIAIPGNLHRDLSDRQRDWLVEVHRNPERDPLLWLVAAILGLRDHLAWWTDWLERIAIWLASLAGVLQNQHGIRWWESMSLAPFWEVQA